MDSQGTIVVVGFGWVGQANALALSFMGHPVFYYDPTPPPPHYGERWATEYKKLGRLQAPLERDGENTWYLLCVGDRVDGAGVQDISSITKALEALRSAKGGTILRSTVLPEHLSGLRFDYYIPEFLHEKHAVEECLNPFYFVAGHGETERQEPEFLAEWRKRAHQSFRGSARDASYIKYLSNIWNALRIAFVNEMGDIMSRGGRDRAAATRVLGFLFDGKSYLRYGRAYGGHCLPKDTLAFFHQYQEHSGLIAAIHESNERHKRVGGYQSLPEWFSQWELEGGFSGRLSQAWKAFNAYPVIRFFRTFLRPVRRFFERFAPSRSLDAAKRLWNRLARRHPLFFSHPGTPSGRRVNEYEFRESGRKEFERLIAADLGLAERLGSFKSRVVLDLGTGVGRHLEFFARDFKEAVGVDISEEMLHVAKDRLSGFQNVRFLPTTGRHLPVPDLSVDLIFSRETFEAIADERVITSYLGEMFRTLRAGGVAKVELRALPSPYRWRYSYGRAITSNEARKLFEAEGFQILSIVPDTEKYLWVTAVKP